MFKNPFYLAAVPIILGFVLYSFHWGTVLQSLSNEVFLLFTLFILAMLLCGFLFSKITNNKNEMYESIQISEPNYVISITIVVFLTFLEGAYFRGFPIMGTISYSTFGIPVIHPIILTFNSYILVSVFYSFGINISKNNNFKYIIKVLVLSIPYILEINRGMLIMTLIAGMATFLVTSNIKIKLKIWIRLFIASIISLYLFGLSGNYRVNIFSKGTDRFLNTQYILSLGGASTLNANHLFEPFYWGYVYLTSSLANLNSTISLLSVNNNTVSFIRFMSVQFLPDFISKRFYPTLLDMSATRVNSQFTTGTVFNSAYYLYGWAGIIITFIYIVILPFCLHLILRNGPSRYYVIGFSFLSSMYLFLFFSSMLSFTGLSLPIAYAVIGSVMNRKKRSELF